MAGRGAEPPLDLEHLPDETLLDLQHGIDSVLVVVLKVSAYKESVSIQRRMAKFVSQAWKDAANAALTTAFGATKPPFTKAKLDTFLRRIGVALRKPLSKDQAAWLGKQVDAIWKIAKRIGAKEVKIPFSFGLRDKEAIAAINRQQVFWVGNFHETHLSKRIQAVSEDIILKQGLPPKEAGRVLQSSLRREYGLAKLSGPSRFAPEVPARFAGRPEQYWEMVTSTSSHQSRTFGRLVSFQEAEIRTYRLENPQDERTGQICQQMHGQVFTVRAGVKQMNRILGAKDPTAVKNIAPWLTPAQTQAAIGGGRRGSPAASAGLSRAGAMLPPFHARCRTDIVIIA